MLDIQAVSTNLKLGQDGIWYSQDSQDISYPSDGNEVCFTIEDKSFWFKHRNNCILAAVKSYPPEDNGTIFDIGGGNGFVSLALEASGFDVALVEPGRTGASNAKRRGLNTVICATTATAQLKPHSLSAIGLFDVVEHIEDDLSFLKSLRGLMKEQGRLYITVPAYSFLWSGEDVSAGHYRRYARNNICKVIEHAGFEVEFSSYIFRFLPIPIALFRVLPYRMGLSLSKNKTQAVARDHAVRSGAIANVLTFVLNSEIENIKNNKKMGFGGSCLIVAKSP
jgi:SAM-dependent methyltransferase